MRPSDGKVALVTGDSAGLGAATALQFAREGARVVIAARRSDQSESVLRRIEGGARRQRLLTAPRADRQAPQLARLAIESH
jgi:NAD(P)-dependent dehydrogenase (short-subunit alcohol dehydrogenase family)